MKPRTLVWIALFFLLSLLAACGGQAATLADMPAPAGATALQTGQDPIADTLVQNMQQDASLRANIGVGGSIEQTAYRLPADMTWEQVKAYYDKELGAAGWKSGMGGPGGNLASSIMESASAGNPLFQTALWSKGKQTLTVVRSASPTSAADVYLILSLNTN